MAELEYVKQIRTEKGDLRIDYNALANLPTSDDTLTQSKMFADAKAVGDQIKSINSLINSLNDNSVKNSTTINRKPLNTNITLSAEDVGAAEEGHEHAASNITSGVFSMERGGTNANNGQDGMKNLLASGAMILSEHQYGDATPTIATSDKEKMIGRIFFVKVAEG